MRPVPKPSKKPKKKDTRSSRLVIYNQLVKPAYLAGLASGQRGGPQCEVCRSRAAIEIHHRMGREGDLLFDARYYLGLCPECHQRIHANPEDAYRRGWMLKRNSLAQLSEGVEELVAEGGAAASEQG